MSRIRPLVSVICPSYNHARYLRQALDSILMQKRDFPIEVLVGEDCSPDNSREILKEYEKTYPEIFQMFYRNENMGATRNAYDLQMRMQGKYAITLETDDYWTDSLKLQKQVNFLESHPEYIGYAHACEVIDEAGNSVARRAADTPQVGRCYTLQNFLQEGFTFQTSTLMHRNIFLDGGDYSITYKAHPLVGDLTLFSILLLRGNIFLSAENMSAYRWVIKGDGTSAASWGANNRAKSLEMTVKQLVTLEEYFQGKIEYSAKKIARCRAIFSRNFKA